MKRLLFVYNPRAGQGKIKGRLPEIVDAFVYRGYLPTVYPTQGRGDATAVVGEIGSGYDRVVCCGGDGTLHEVVTALMAMDRPPTLGYIPAGTTNDFSRNLDLPRDLALAANVAVGEDVMACDIGRFNNSAYFVYVAAFGLFTDVSYNTPQQFKNLFGQLAYILGGIGSLAAIKSWEMTVEHDGGTVEGEFIYGMVSNTRSVGGFQGWPKEEVDLADGQFEVILVRKPENAGDTQSILHSVFSQRPEEDGPMIAFHTSRISFTARDKVAWTLDGEYGGKHTQVQVENIHRPLELCYRKLDG